MGPGGAPDHQFTGPKIELTPNTKEETDAIRLLLLHEECDGPCAIDRSSTCRLLAWAQTNELFRRTFCGQVRWADHKAQGAQDAERLVAGDAFLQEGLLERHWAKEWAVD